MGREDVIALTQYQRVSNPRKISVLQRGCINMTHYNFDESNINWNQIEGFDHLSLFILDIDRDNLIVDVLLKFEANEKIALHRHVALNHMLVIQGEHILFHTW